MIPASSAAYVAPDNITQSDWRKVRHRISLMMRQQDQSAVPRQAASRRAYSRLPVQDNLAALAGAHDLKSGLELCDRKAVRYDFPNVETAF